MTVFVSYSRDHERVAALVAALRRHGLRPWRDQDSLGSGARTEDEIAAEIASCDVVMIWIGGDTLISDFVCRIEIPLAIAKHRTRGTRIVPLFVDVGARDGIDAVRAATGYEIGGHNGHVFADEGSLEHDLEDVASAEVATHLLGRIGADRRPVVRCVTRSDGAAGREQADLNFDWIREYPADGSLPDAPTTAVLTSALHASMQHVLATFGIGAVELHLKCHLHLGVAIGFELRRVTGAVPRVAVEHEWWTCDARISRVEGAGLAEHTTAGPADATRSAVEISLSRDVTPAVSAYVMTSGARYRERIRLAPQSGPDQLAVDATLVNPWAEQVADAIRRARAHPGVEDVDVFIAAPIGFAVTLGWRLNAIGGVHLFHPEGNAGPYREVWALPPS